MTSHARVLRLSKEEYLEGEKHATVKHEYVAGQIFAMVGVSQVHNTIAINLTTALHAHLRGGPCRVRMAEVKVRVEAADAFYYPDVVVTCDPDDTEEYHITRPCLIIEVLSPSTEATDRREKLLAYQQLDSLMEYVLVVQTTKQVEVYRRDRGDEWSLDTFTGSDEIHLDSVDLAMGMEAVYAGASG